MMRWTVRGRRNHGFEGHTVLAWALSALLAGTSTLAFAQEPARGRSERAPESTGGGEGDRTNQAGESTEVEAHEDDQQKVKVFEFGGLDISGELKSPQLLYFLNRLRAEFERPKLPHRSFMSELKKSANDEALR